MRNAPVYAILCALSLWVVSGRAVAEVIAVPQNGAPETPTLTMYWQGAGSRALLLLIPGGEGQLHLRPGQTDVGYQFYQTLRHLSRGSNPRDNLDVVLFDSPERLAISNAYPRSRTTIDHLSRIRSVIRFYKERTGKPVWLMGHSNGAISATEYVRYAHKLGEDSAISGLIVSSPNGATYFDSTPLNFPILFMSHRKEGCPGAAPDASYRNFKKAEGLDSARTSFVYIETGSPEDRSPCASGYHMYNGAGEEVQAALRSFILSPVR